MPNFILIINLLFLLFIIHTKNYVVNSSSSSTCDNNGQVIFNFPKFKPSNCKKGGELLCMGAVNPGEGYLNLTTVSSNNTSTDDFNGIARVLYHNSLQIWPTSFCTSFSFKISPRLDQVFTGDGMTFVIAPNNLPSPQSSFGSYLGLQDSKLAGVLDQEHSPSKDKSSQSLKEANSAVSWPSHGFGENERGLVKSSANIEGQGVYDLSHEVPSPSQTIGSNGFGQTGKLYNSEPGRGPSSNTRSKTQPKA